MILATRVKGAYKIIVGSHIVGEITPKWPEHMVWEALCFPHVKHTHTHIYTLATDRKVKPD